MTAEQYILGIDVGSVSAGFVVVDSQRRILHKGYAAHHGNVSATLRRLLEVVDLGEIGFVAATASTPSSLFAQARYNNQIAFITAAKKHHPQMRGLLVVGGEKFNLSTFNAFGNYLGSTTNTSCAAGTGSFLDQQAGRLQLADSAKLTEIACNCTGGCPQIASRCAVFAKTDLIHAQQEGYQLDEISNGLCHGLAKNIVDTLFSSGTAVSGEIVFCGGVAKNRAVTKHIAELTGLSLTVPENGHLYGALGACLLHLTELQNGQIDGKRLHLESLDDLFNAASIQPRQYYHPPLQLQLSQYPDFTSLDQYHSRRGKDGLEVEVDIYQDLAGRVEIDAYLGIDIGSTSTKAVLVDSDCEVLAGFYTRTAGRPLSAVQDIFFAIAEIEEKKGLRFAIKQSGTTGSGRKFIGKLIGADQIIDEITAHARAAYQLCPEVDTIIEIGGQDAKFTTMKNGRVTFSTMNSVCAAGTGSFIEEQAAKLGCPVDQYSARAENLSAPLTSDRCTVFMERDINHLLSEGYKVDEVLAAALHSVRENYLQKVATEKHIGKTVLFQGATAKNRALVAAFEQGLQQPILVSKFCHLTGALGTALILRDEGQTKTTFAGIGLHQKSISLSNTVCELCTNHCKISVAEVDGQKTAYGFLCGRDYEDQAYVARPSTAFDLLRERKRLGRTSRQTPAKGSSFVIGLPAAVYMVEDMHLWQRFFALLGIATISSESSEKAAKEGKKLSQAEFCAPIAAMHGHAKWLLDRADYVFMPIYLENKVKSGRRQYCYYSQFLPSLTAGLQAEDDGRFLRPVIKYLYTPFHTKMQLYRMLQGIAPGQWNFFEVSSAYDRAIEADQQYRQGLKDLYTARLASKEGSDISVVFVGRPYTLLSPSLNNNIPELFNNLGIDSYFQDMLSYNADDLTTLQPLLEEIHWEYAAKILEAATVIASTPGVYPVFVTSFKCSPDSFTVEYFKKIMDRHGKPYLILSLDGHDSSVGYETRIEAAIRAFRNHRDQGTGTEPLPVTYHSLNPQPAGALTGKHVLFPNWDHITCSLLTATLKREGFDTYLLEETEQTIRESLRHNSGQCIPLNAIAEDCMAFIRKNRLNPGDCVLWLNYSTMACNIRLYPHHIKQIFIDQGSGMEHITVYQGDISFSDISIRAAKNAYFAYMLGGMLQKVVCKVRPYETEKGRTDKILSKSIKVLADAFMGKRPIEKTLDEIVCQFEWIETAGRPRPKVAIFGDLYSRDNQVMNQDLIRFIEANGGEVVTTPYSEFCKMIARSYFRKWFNEGKYLDYLTGKALLTTMGAMEKSCAKILGRILDGPEPSYTDEPEEILARYHISVENTGESMDNILKIHYLTKHYPDLSLLVQASPALCCASLITEAMKARIEKHTGIPVVSVTYDGTGGCKNEIIAPYLKYPRLAGTAEIPAVLGRGAH
ncbi:MAG: acyl-CoA dehydratase activase [Desulforhopalus sp.]|nr:acyl-CoA dehydratase activase [Desulforhopalus sp.]